MSRLQFHHCATRSDRAGSPHSPLDRRRSPAGAISEEASGAVHRPRRADRLVRGRRTVRSLFPGLSFRRYEPVGFHRAGYLQVSSSHRLQHRNRINRGLKLPPSVPCFSHLAGAAYGLIVRIGLEVSNHDVANASSLPSCREVLDAPQKTLAEIVIRLPRDEAPEAHAAHGLVAVLIPFPSVLSR